MKQCESAINTLIEEYRKLPSVKGIFWGGSSNGHEPEAYSDIDLFIVTDNDARRCQGHRIIEGQKLEYFFNPIERLKKQMQDELSIIHDYWVIKIYAFSTILYDPTGEASALQAYARERFEEDFSDIDKARDIQNFYFAYDAWQKYLGAFERDENWRITYYECLKQLLYTYCYHIGVPLVPWNKAERLMKDKEYRTRYHLKKLPDQYFCDLFLKCLYEGEKREMKMKLEILYEYCTKDSGFDPDDIKILK